MIIGVVTRIEYLNSHLSVFVEVLGSNSVASCTSAKVDGDNVGDGVVLLEQSHYLNYNELGQEGYNCEIPVQKAEIGSYAVG